MSPLTNCIKNNDTKTNPIWLMRQAGRYLPEYQLLRKEAGSFINLCMDPLLAKEVTLQPITRYNMDAAIVFSDILTIPMSCNRNFSFVENIGPILDPIIKEKEILDLKIKDYKFLEPIYKTLELVRKELSADKTLIGFTGAPFTIALYMIEGGASKSYKKSITFYKNNTLNYFTKGVINHKF